MVRKRKHQKGKLFRGETRKQNRVGGRTDSRGLSVGWPRGMLGTDSTKGKADSQHLNCVGKAKEQKKKDGA